MPQSVIRHLRENNIISSTKDGASIVFDRESVEKFQKDFNRAEYIPKSECDKNLRKYVTRVKQPTKNKKTMGLHDHPVGIYLSGVKLINGSDEIPDEYRLDVREIGEAQYITKKSFAKTLNWLDSLYEKENPRKPPYVPMKTEKKRSRTMRDALLKNKKRLKSRSSADSTVDDLTREIEENRDKWRKKVRSRLTIHTSS
jgi:hypothetical protein